MKAILNTSNLEKIEWNNNNLEIFYTSGQVVVYKDVPEGIAVGMSQAPSAGSYMNRFICGTFSYEVIKKSNMAEENNELRHFKDTTVGLWATDKPELIPEEIKNYFFEIS